MSRAELLYKQKIKAYRWLYEFTQSQCSDCALTDCACKDSICSHVEDQSSKLGVQLPRTGHRLRFIGCNGCVVAPHLRETCTAYLCEPAQLRPEFQRDKFERLKTICFKLDEKLMNLIADEDHHCPQSSGPAFKDYKRPLTLRI